MPELDSRRVDDGRSPTVRSVTLGNLLLLASILVSAAVAILIAITLLQSREEAWDKARQSSRNIVGAISQNISYKIQLYSFLLDDIVDAAGGVPGDLNHQTLRGFLDRAFIVTPYIGSLVVLDRQGNITADAGQEKPRSGRFSDRDYFQVHEATRSESVYISEPYLSRMRNGDPSVALSRRLDDRHGRFAGIVLAAIRLAYFRELFRDLELGPKGALSLVKLDGTLVLREPSIDGTGDVGRNLASSPIFEKMRMASTGSFTAVAQLDGVERFYTFSHVPNAPLIVSAGVAVDTILEGWRKRATVIGVLTTVICLTSIGAAFLGRREMISRARAEAELQLLSMTDELTGMANRRKFEIVFAREWRRAQRTSSSLCLLVIDADHFKQLNDVHGHARGDEALVTIGKAIEAQIRRPDDLAARIGGEEFAVVLPGADTEGAETIAEKIRRAVSREVVRGPAGVPIRFTVSVGVACADGQAARTSAELLDAADQALYRAKAAGRNRVAVAWPTAAQAD